jgi:hypothetical protein
MRMAGDARNQGVDWRSCAVLVQNGRARNA